MAQASFGVVEASAYGLMAKPQLLGKHLESPATRHTRTHQPFQTPPKNIHTFLLGPSGDHNMGNEFSMPR